MANTPAPPASAERSAKPTIAAVLKAIMADESLPLRKRKAMAGALRTVCKAFQTTPDLMSASPRYIAERLAGFEPAMANLAPGTWTNALSFTRAALRHVGQIKTLPRAYVSFAPKWTALLALMPKSADRIGLSRLARFCSDRDVSPEDVDNGTFEALLADMTENQVIKLPKKAHRRAAVLWNAMATKTRNWPSTTVTVPNYSRAYALPWSSFPTTLKDEIDQHLAFMSGGDPLSYMEVPSLKPRSIKTRCHQLHVYVSALVLSGEDPQDLKSLKDVVEVRRVRLGLTFFNKRRNAGREAVKSAQAHDIARMLLSIAKHHVQACTADLEALRKFRKSLEEKKRGLTGKNRARLRVFDDEQNVWKLMNLPAQLMAEASKAPGKPSRADALLAQTAVAIELLLNIPMRRENLTHLSLEKHIIRGRNNTARIAIEPAEVKNDMPIEAKLTPTTVMLLDRYLTRFRPSLLTEASPWIFVGVGSRSKSCERLALQISDTIKERLGFLVNVHLFRALAAKLYLQLHPDGWEVVRLILGHQSLATTLKSYAGLEALAAVALYDASIMRFRPAQQVQLATMRGH